MPDTTTSDDRPLTWDGLGVVTRFVLLAVVLMTVLATGWGIHMAAAQTNATTARTPAATRT